MPIDPQTQLFAQIQRQNRLGPQIAFGQLGQGIQQGTNSIVEALQRIAEQKRQEEMLKQNRAFTLERDKASADLRRELAGAADAKAKAERLDNLRIRLASAQTPEQRAAIQAVIDRLSGAEGTPAPTGKFGAGFTLGAKGSEVGENAPIPKEDIPAGPPSASTTSKAVGFGVMPPLGMGSAAPVGTVEELTKRVSPVEPSEAHGKALLKRLSHDAIINPQIGVDQQTGAPFVANPIADPAGRFAQELALAARANPTMKLSEFVEHAVETARDPRQLDEILSQRVSPGGTRDEKSARREGQASLVPAPGLFVTKNGIEYKGKKITPTQLKSLQEKGSLVIPRGSRFTENMLSMADPTADLPLWRTRKVGNQDVIEVVDGMTSEKPLPIRFAVHPAQRRAEFSDRFIRAYAREIGAYHGLKD